jgi:F-type H+-transporting ATPase subunit gamma
MRPDEKDLSSLERRMDAVAAVRQVVNAIWALARAQLPHVEEASAEVVAYLEQVEAVVSRLAGPPRPPASTARSLVVLMGPERAWCGSLPRELLAQLPEDAELGLVGRRLQEVVAEAPPLRARVRFALPGATSPEDATQVALAVAERLLAHLDVAHVELWHPVGGGRRLTRAVLLGRERERRHTSPPTLSPWEEVLRAAVFEVVTSRLAVGAVEALRSEVVARVAAADQARAAAERQLGELQQAWRVARQEQITSELVELVAGRGALMRERHARG